MGVSINSAPVFLVETPKQKWRIIQGYPHDLGNLHIYIYILYYVWVDLPQELMKSEVFLFDLCGFTLVAEL